MAFIYESPIGSYIGSSGTAFPRQRIWESLDGATLLTTLSSADHVVNATLESYKNRSDSNGC